MTGRALSADRARRRYLGALLLGVASIGLAFGSWVMLDSRGDDVRAERLRAGSAERAQAVRHEFEICASALRAVQAFFAGSERVEPAEFELFADAIREQHDGLVGLQWVEYVRDDARSAFEARRGYEIRQRVEIGGIARMARRGEQADYYAVTARVPANDDGPPIGWDWGVRGADRQQLEFAAKSDVLVALSAGVEAGALPERHVGLFVAVPIYDNRADVVTLANPVDALTGFVIGRIDLTELVGSATERLYDLGLDVYLLDSDPTGGAVKFAAAGGHEAVALSSERRSELRRSGHVVDLGRRSWILAGVAAPEFGSEGISVGPWIALAVGLVLSLVVIGYIASLAGRASRVEDEVARRTADLEAANRDLERSRRELSEAKDAAEAAAEQKAELLANLSHEIRSPMNGIVGLTDLLLRTELTAEQQQYQELVKRSTDSLRLLLDDILDTSRIDSGRLELEATEFSLREIVEDTLQSLAPHAAEKQIELVANLPRRVPDRFVGDPVRFRQVLVNLAGNAVKFTDRGEVVVSVDPVARRSSETSVELGIEVRDTGIGIAADRQTEIFDAFRQADSSTTRRFGGTGLGLAIARRLVNLMGGEVSVDSAPGRGSTFRFTACLQIAPRQPAPTVLQADLGQVGVLVVEDHAALRQCLADIFEQWGIEAVVTASLADAVRALDVAAATDRGFRVALVDARLLRGNRGDEGVDRFVAAVERLGTTPIVLAGLATDREDAAPFGDARRVLKPLRRAELREALLDAALGRSRPVRSPTNGIGGRANPAAASSGADPRGSTRRLTVLLAEDGTVNQMVATRLLELRGHRVVVAGNGEDAVKLVGQREFDVVLMDVQMPVMDGYEATARIRERESERRVRRTPIIALTAHAIRGDRERCLEAGMDAYVSKPFDVAELCAVVERVATPGANGDAAPGHGANGSTDS